MTDRNSLASPPTKARTERTTAGLRDVLFDAIDDLRGGRIDARQALATAKLAETVVKTVEMQMTYERLRLDSKVPGVLPEMKLVPALPRATDAG